MNSISFGEYGYPEYHYCPEDDPPPAYNSNPPEYGHRAVFGISQEADEWIVGQTPHCYLDSCEKVFYLTDTARRHRSRLALLPSTRAVVANAFSFRRSLSAGGLVSLPTAIVHDIVKPSYHIFRMSIALCQGKYESIKAENEISEEILDSLLLSLERVLRIVVRIGLETHQSVEQQMQEDQGYYLYLTLARLLEAYGSRFAPPGTVYLASKKRLPKGHCHGVARLHFDQIHNLKSNLLSVNLSPANTLTDASAEVQRWIRKVLPALKRSWVDMGENDQFSCFLQRIRNIRNELVGLVVRVTEK